jgi:hypothetical protein
MSMAQREHLIGVLQHAFSGQTGVQAVWIGGSEAFGRADDLSDVDCLVLVDDAQVESAFAVAEGALSRQGEITYRYRMPMPTWHGHAQALYQVSGLSRFCFLDLCVLAASHSDRFLDLERHGRPRVLYDPQGVIRPVPIDPAAWRRRLQVRIQDMRALAPIYALLTEKALLRQDPLAALSIYQKSLLPQLVELLRLRHSPYRHDFGLRYLADDLPAAAVREVTAFAFVADAAALSLQAPALAQRVAALADEVATAVAATA